MRPECCDPEAPIMPCEKCGDPLHTCERKNPVDGSYLCPVPEHNTGLETSNGTWLCSRCFYEEEDEGSGEWS